MVRATFQETWIIGTIDFTFFTSFHSKRSRASWYWYARGAEKKLMRLQIGHCRIGHCLGFVVLFYTEFPIDPSIVFDIFPIKPRCPITYSWVVPRSRQCCCTSPPPGPSVQSLHWSTPGLPASEWSGTPGCWSCKGLPGLATRTLLGSLHHAWGKQVRALMILQPLATFVVKTNILVHSLLTECVDGLPIVLMDSKPLTVTRSDVDVDWTEVVVLLMTWWGAQTERCLSRVPLSCDWVVRRTLTWCAAARHLHVELHGVHAQDGVTDVAQHVVAGFHAHESRQLQQLLQLGLPPFKRAQRVMWVLQ